MNLLDTKTALENKGQDLLEKLYTKAGVKDNLKRYEDVLQGFVREFGKKDVKLFISGKNGDFRKSYGPQQRQGAWRKYKP